MACKRSPVRLRYSPQTSSARSKRKEAEGSSFGFLFLIDFLLSGSLPFEIEPVSVAAIAANGLVAVAHGAGTDAAGLAIFTGFPACALAAAAGLASAACADFTTFCSRSFAALAGFSVCGFSGRPAFSAVELSVSGTPVAVFAPPSVAIAASRPAFASAGEASRPTFTHTLRTFGATGTVAGVAFYPSPGAGQQHAQDDQSDASAVI